jgi:formylglycine-generating enzyme required for sulfatase activity
MDIEVTEALDTSGLYPVISQHPDIAPAGSKFLQRGTGFSPNNRVTIHVRRPDGTNYTVEPIYTDGDGNFATEFPSSPERPLGEYVWWAEDITGVTSAEKTYQVTNPNAAGSLAIVQLQKGNRFYQGGAGFTPNSTATIYLRNPDGSVIAVETVPTMADGTFLTSFFATDNKPEGQYFWWAVDDTTGTRSQEETYTIGGTVDLERFTNSLGMEFVRIPAGTFMMGSPETELGRKVFPAGDHEKLHSVTLTQDFFIMKTEVTQQQWVAVMGENPSHVFRDDYPVNGISWYDAKEFIAALSSMEGTNYRLPTEAEWEYAARAGSSTALANGEISVTGCGFDPNLDEMAWYCNTPSEPNVVAQKSPNDWGLYDMYGNVREWCQDWFGLYPVGPVENPNGPETGDYKVLRGGYFYSNASECRSASRYNRFPSVSSWHYGVRLALTPGQ